MFKTSTKPVPGAALKASLDRIEETWAEMETEEPLNKESARMLQRDLFELVGMVKALTMCAELSQAPEAEGE